ncbi:MAG: hypothetical protein ACLVFN_02580 [Enterocloster sp.]
MGLCRSNPYMFQVVECSQYMRKINDGRCIYKEVDEWMYADGYFEDGTTRLRSVPEEDIGGNGIVKTYYEITDKKFTGVVTGLKELVTKAELYVDVEYYYDGSEKEYVTKDVTECMKVAVVAYGCNRVRYVPLNCLEIVRPVEGEKRRK